MHPGLGLYTRYEGDTYSLEYEAVLMTVQKPTVIHLNFRPPISHDSTDFINIIFMILSSKDEETTVTVAQNITRVLTFSDPVTCVG
jgi:hypothetical protein